MSKATIFIAGDFCSKPSTSLITVSGELRSKIQSCDLKVINFEVPLKPKGKLEHQERERFYQNDDAPTFLKDLGFNLFSLANNHAFDCGCEGFLKTKDALGDGAFGAGTYNEAYKVKVLDVNGIKIGFLALCFAAYKGVFDDVANRNKLGCAYINDLCVNHVILNAKKDVDFLFVLPHDGIEYIDVPLPETIARYRDFIDYGADGVIASHPHCPQGWEEYKGKPIFYSLGNFFFNSKEDTLYRATNRPHWYEGRCVVLTVENNSINWEIINTSNIDNVAIQIDSSDESNEHNNVLCSLLHDDKSYSDYLYPILERQASFDLKKIQASFEPVSFVQVFKRLLCKRKKMPLANREEVANMLRHDLKKYRLVRFLKANNNEVKQ